MFDSQVLQSLNLQTVSVAIGAGLTAFLLVAVLVLELVPFEFSALDGLPVGLVTALITSCTGYSTLTLHCATQNQELQLVIVPPE